MEKERVKKREREVKRNWVILRYGYRKKREIVKERWKEGESEKEKAIKIVFNLTSRVRT